MGIFTDLYAQAGLNDAKPQAGGRVVKNDLDYLRSFYGDLEYPSGFAGRPALAILHVTGVIGSDVPVSGGTTPLTILFDRGNNFNTPKEPTIRFLANQAAIEDDNADLEEAILTGIKYHNLPSQSHIAPTPENLAPVLCWNGDCDGFLWNGFGPIPPGQTQDIPYSFILSDPNITGSELDTVICEMRITKSGDAPSDWMWMDIPNAVTAGVTFVQGSAADEPGNVIMRGTLNQLNAALIAGGPGARITLKAFGTPANPLEYTIYSFQLSDLGHAGPGGEKLSAIGQIRCEATF